MQFRGIHLSPFLSVSLPRRYYLQRRETRESAASDEVALYLLLMVLFVSIDSFVFLTAKQKKMLF